MVKYIDINEKELNIFYDRVVSNIRRIRKEKGMTQLDLSLSIGHKSTSIISQVEAGIEDTKYNLDHLYKIAKVLEVDVRDFFNEL